jgi:hypothetical protein
VAAGARHVMQVDQHVTGGARSVLPGHVAIDGEVKSDASAKRKPWIRADLVGLAVSGAGVALLGLGELLAVGFARLLDTVA